MNSRLSANVARTTQPTAGASGLPGLELAHRQVRQVLAQMLEMAEKLTHPEQDPAAAALAAQVCAFFDEPTRGHHEAEETTVFPALLATGTAGLRAQVRQLQQDHMWLEEDWLELEPHLRAVAAGYCEAHRRFLPLALREYAGMYHQHMDLEESLLHLDTGRGVLAPDPAA